MFTIKGGLGWVMDAFTRALDVKKIMKVTAWKARNELCDLWA